MDARAHLHMHLRTTGSRALEHSSPPKVNQMAAAESYSALPLLGNARGDSAAFGYTPVELQQRSCTFLDVLLAPFICAVRTHPSARHSLSQPSATG
jgi:hypothetical protein